MLINIKHVTFTALSTTKTSFKNGLFLYNTSRSSCLQIFLKIGIFKSFTNFTGKHLCWSLFLKNLQAEGLKLHKKRLQHSCFPAKFVKLLRYPFLTEHLQWLLLYFFKKVLFISYLQPCYNVLMIFSWLIVWFIKSRTCLFISVLSIVRFFK